MAAFQKRTIDKYIRNRIKYWLFDLNRNAPLYLQDQLELSTNDKEKLTDEDKEKITNFLQQVQNDVIVTGGCFTSMLQGENPNDLDIYFATNETAINIAWFYLNKMKSIANLDSETNPRVSNIDVKSNSDGVQIYIKSQGIASEEIDNNEYSYFEAHEQDDVDNFFKDYRGSLTKADFENNKFGVSFLTSNAITLNNGLQIITRFTGDIDFIHSNFDFIHATNYWTWAEGVVYNDKALTATLEKRLYYFGSKFPVASIFRMRKFIERGWYISAGEMLKIAWDISKLDLSNISVLREQSIGMDSAYFNEVISLLMMKDNNENSIKEIDRTYLFQCIDMIFKLHKEEDLNFEFSTEDTVDEENFTLEE